MHANKGTIQMNPTDQKRLIRISQVVWEIQVRLEELQREVNTMRQDRQLPLLGGDPVMTTKEVLAYLRVSSTTLNRYRVGRVPKGKPPFPKPIGRGAYGKRYRRQDIERWSNAEMN